MKKVFICLLITLLISGCQGTNETLKCTSTTTTNGVTTNITYDIQYNEDDVKYVTIKHNYQQDNTNNNDTNTTASNNDISAYNNDDTTTDTTNTDNGNNNTTNNNETRNQTDGINADTDGLTEDNDVNANDNIIDGVVGDTIDGTAGIISDTILDIAGIRNNYNNQMATFDNIAGFDYNVDTDNEDEYTIVYEIDLEEIDDTNLARFNIDRNLTNTRTTYEDLGYTCK